ncbi:MAG: hypothetical protein ABIW19_20335 [Vicinamibacterales bacterium]
MFLLLMTAALPYAVEARPYGLLLGCSSAAVALWVYSNRSGASPLVTGALIATLLVAAVWVHWFGVLAWFVVGILEVWQFRLRLRPQLWLPLVAGGLLCLPLFPFAMHAKEYSAVMVWRIPDVWSLWTLYAGLLPASTLVLGLVIGVVGAREGSRTSATQNETKRLAPALRSAVMLALIPFLGYLLALGGVGVVTVRYTLAGAAGVSMLIALALVPLVASRRTLALCTCLLAAGAFEEAAQIKHDMTEVGAVRNQIGPFSILRTGADSGDVDLPILVSDIHVYLPLIQYAPTSLAHRLVYVTGQNPQATFQMERYAQWFPVRTLSQEQAFAATRFLIYVAGDDLLLPGALNRGWHVSAEPLGINPQTFPRPGYLLLAERIP